MEFGVVQIEADGKVAVGMEMPSDLRTLAKDDVIVTINGQAVDSLAAFREIYEATEIGDDLELTYSHDDEEQSLTRVKVEASGMIRMGSHP
jgi:S1-C subfamily serine protease